MSEIMEQVTVHVFKTNFESREEAHALHALLGAHAHRWSIDLEDVDRVLRVEADTLPSTEIINLVRSTGHECAELE